MDALLGLHRDRDSWAYLATQVPDLELLVSANIALTQFTHDNGATLVVPGSHRWPRARQAQPEEIEQAAMPRGSALLYSGNVMHGGGANRSETIRIGMYLGFIPSWLKPIENHVITSGEAAILATPPATRHLFDYHPQGFDWVA